MTGLTPRCGFTTFGDPDIVDPTLLNVNTSRIDTVINSSVNIALSSDYDGKWNLDTQSDNLSRFNAATSGRDLISAGRENRGNYLNYTASAAQHTVIGGSATNIAQLCISVDIEDTSPSIGAEFYKIVAQGHLALYGSMTPGVNIDAYVYIATQDDPTPVSDQFAINRGGAITRLTLNSSRIGQRIPYFIDTVFDARGTTVFYITLNFIVNTTLFPATASIGVSATDAAPGYTKLWIHGMGNAQ